MTALTTYLKSSLIIAAVAFIIYYVVRTYLSYRKLRRIKGPFLATVSTLWLFYQTLRGRVNVACAEVLHEYGSPARIGPSMIVTDDPIIQRYVAALRSPFVKGHWFKGMEFDPRMDNILSMTDEKGHKELREK